jgi:hypothetical protein
VHLPFASASGFKNLRTDLGGFVFCARVGDLTRFRFVPTNAEWQVQVGPNGLPVVYDDTLTSLIVADPQAEDTHRELSTSAYEAAFDAWAVAKVHLWEERLHLSDGTALIPDVPKALRDAAELLYENPDALGASDRDDLIARLSTSPPARIQKEVRSILQTDSADAQKLREIRTLLIESGVQPAVAPPNIAPIDPEEVRLVCWLAVSPGLEEVAQRRVEAVPPLT